jgi:ABC-type nickel/cobalt efflux system permease component RcnA
VKQTREPGPRLSPPPPLEGNDQLVTGVITAGWAIALIVLLIVRSSIPSDARWWIWTCAAGLGLGLFGLWYLPRLKRSRARAAEARADESAGPDQSAPRDSGSKTVSSTETPGRSTRS